MPRHDASGPLLDAAERLIAQLGLPNVSDRKIAEAAGNSNHSAVRYYFGGREGLVLALTERHRAAMDPYRRALAAQNTSLRTTIELLVVPPIRVLTELPAPSWRARCMVQILTDPAHLDRLQQESGWFDAARVYTALTERLTHLDPDVARNRVGLVAHLITTTTAAIEARAEQSGKPTDWREASDFLCDAIEGMLTGPVTPARTHRHDPAAAHRPDSPPSQERPTIVQ